MNFEPVIQRPKNNHSKTVKDSVYYPSVVSLRQDNMEESTDNPQNELKSRTEELRLVLFGHGWLQKSLTGNTILQQKMFDTGRDVKMCVRRQTLSQDGKRMIMVNTPDRWLQYHVQDPSLMNDNMAECLSMCQPGPHAFLMVVPLGLSQGREWTVEGPLSLLNDHVWKKTIVVFTRPEKLNGITVEDYIIERPFLKPLLERCGHRHHLLDTSFYGHESQVRELLERIGAMVEEDTQNWGSTEMENREKVEVKAKVRQSDVRATKSALRSLFETHAPAKEQHILVVGRKQVGKSSTCKTLLCQAQVHTKKITVVDTPGWHGREKEEARQSIVVEGERFDKKLREMLELRGHMEAEAIKLQEEKKRLETENECTKMMLHSVVTEVQKQFKKKLNLQRKMATDVSTSEMLFRLENDEDDHSSQSREVEKKPQSPLSSGWVLAAGAALGAALGSALGGVGGRSQQRGVVEGFLTAAPKTAVLFQNPSNLVLDFWEGYEAGNWSQVEEPEGRKPGLSKERETEGGVAKE
uniref:AIG1-type G domain-containing protein n=1 Tax=Knipowitschia caucasica TaxID=637954 RepID=A0AAV2JYT8_KNICA